MNPPEVTQPVPAQLLHRQIPTIAYTFQNILISLASLVVAVWSILFTAVVVLPVSVIKVLVLRSSSGKTGQGGKVVLIVGASKGIGYNVLKQYAGEPDTTIIAASRSIDSLRKATSDLGPTRATIEYAEIDLTASKRHLEEEIRTLDEKYGPITHLYEVSGIWNYKEGASEWGLDVTEDMINVNISGTVACVLTMYEIMKTRRSGKICIVGSVAALHNPANMISYASTKSFIHTFSTSLRVLAAPLGVEVVTVHPGFIDTDMTKQMLSKGTDMSVSVPKGEFVSAQGMARKMREAVEGGGVGVVSWPVRQSVVMYAMRGLNPICDELSRWCLMKIGMVGKKIT